MANARNVKHHKATIALNYSIHPSCSSYAWGFKTHMYCNRCKSSVPFAPSTAGVLERLKFICASHGIKLSGSIYRRICCRELPPLIFEVVTPQHCMAHDNYDQKQLQRRCRELRVQQNKVDKVMSDLVGFRLPCFAAGVRPAHTEMSSQQCRDCKCACCLQLIASASLA